MTDTPDSNRSLLLPIAILSVLALIGGGVALLFMSGLLDGDGTDLDTGGAGPGPEGRNPGPDRKPGPEIQTQQKRLLVKAEPMPEGEKGSHVHVVLIDGNRQLIRDGVVSMRPREQNSQPISLSWGRERDGWEGRNLEPGNYEIRYAASPSDMAFTIIETELSEGEAKEYTYQIPLFNLRGTVRSNHDRPISELKIWIDYWHSEKRMQLLPSAFISGNSFEIRGIPYPTTCFTVQSPGFGLVSRKIRCGQFTNRAIDIELDPARPITLQIRSPEGVVPDTVDIVFKSDRDWTTGRIPHAVAPDGTIRVELGQGTFVAFLYCDGFRPAKVQLGRDAFEATDPVAVALEKAD